MLNNQYFFIDSVLFLRIQVQNLLPKSKVKSDDLNNEYHLKNTV